MNKLYYGHMGQETLAGFINRRYREYQLAKQRAAMAQKVRYTQGGVWAIRMRQLIAAKKNWKLAEKLADSAGEKIIMIDV